MIIGIKDFTHIFSDTTHYCFTEQKKSNETNEIGSWNIVTEKDPFKNS